MGTYTTCLHADEVLIDFAEFSGMDLGEIDSRIAGHKRANADEFNSSPGPREFYSGSEGYVFDLLASNRTRAAVVSKLESFLPGIMSAIESHPGRRFMEFGGGLGVFCQVVRERSGKEVTYVDVEGRVSQFARWRLARRCPDVRALIVDQERPELGGPYDVVFTDAVIEHLEPARQAKCARMLSDTVAPGGLLFMLVDLGGHEPDMPMHFDVDPAALFRALESGGLAKVLANGEFATVWRRPA